VGQPNKRVRLKEIQLKLFISEPTTEIGRWQQAAGKNEGMRLGMMGGRILDDGWQRALAHIWPCLFGQLPTTTERQWQQQCDQVLLRPFCCLFGFLV